MPRTSSRIFLVLICLMVFAQGGNGGKADHPDSRLWPVGDSAGWSFSVLGWPNYKPFKVGDVLLFNYKHGAHNVVQVNTVAQYSMCEVPRNATVWSSGNDRITLARGMSFYICGIPGHCQKGMKIAVTAR
ncbi:unnamed protein product [Urochloa decumbens]|uniref:Plantacyanin n=1 Tax=Urochloa decumbens TaxID=240449 RepID=A0ABC9DAC8_9POAL